jgi:hypothetical protein
MTKNWPFSDPPNLAVITIKQIINQISPILHVTHDRDDGGWQFLGWEQPREEDAMIVSLQEIFDRDSSIGELADLPLGWHAWRKTQTQAWQRGEHK